MARGNGYANKINCFGTPYSRGAGETRALIYHGPDISQDNFILRLWFLRFPDKIESSSYREEIKKSSVRVAKPAIK
jgi:hypothetical protein